MLPEKLEISTDDAKQPVKFAKRIQSQDGLDYQDPVEGSTFEASVAVDEGKRTKIVFLADNKKIKVRANMFTGLSDLMVSYTQKGNAFWVLRNGKINVLPASSAQKVVLELLTNISILLNWKILSSMRKFFFSETGKDQVILTRMFKLAATIVESIITIPKAITLRAMYHLGGKSNKPIWLVSDRVNAAGDNGEVFFEYVMGRDDRPADTYFVIDKNSADYERLSRSGEVVSYGSFRHLSLFLRADKVISSHADLNVINPFVRQIDRFCGLFDFDFVFLQHGIIRHDLSGWLNRFNRNIALFITSSENEKESILKNPYYYENEVVLTGLPRYDRLQSKPENKLIFTPTYRKGLLVGISNNKGERSYNSEFKNSDYFKFIDGFMNDERVINALKYRNMKGELYLHPALSKQVIDFEGNDTFQVMKFPYDYNAALCKGDVMVSDYSSITFDFAYMRKPIVYAQLDKESFYKEHTSKETDLFDDEKDGFGPVCYDHESLVDKTIEVLESGARMSNKYMKRAEEYFEFKDRSNTERVYRAILEIDRS